MLFGPSTLKRLVSLSYYDRSRFIVIVRRSLSGRLAELNLGRETLMNGIPAQTRGGTRGRHSIRAEKDLSKSIRLTGATDLQSGGARWMAPVAIVQPCGLFMHR